jgi:translation initiation factor IF-2
MNNNGKVRIYELSKELNLDNRDILTVCDKLNISVKSHSSTITEEEAAQIRAAAENYTPAPAAKSSSQSPSKPSVVKPPVKKQQILEVRRNRSLSEPPRRPEAEVTAPAAATPPAVPPKPSAPARPSRPGEAVEEPSEALEAEPEVLEPIAAEPEIEEIQPEPEPVAPLLGNLLCRQPAQWQKLQMPLLVQLIAPPLGRHDLRVMSPEATAMATVTAELPKLS